MQTRTWIRRCVRLASASATVGLWFVLGQYFSDELDETFEPSPLWNSLPEPDTTPWLFDFSHDKLDILMGYTLAFVAMIVGGLILVGITELSKWIWRGPSDYVDPCNDSSCPCKRHVVERRRAEAARTAMIAATTASVISIVNN